MIESADESASDLANLDTLQHRLREFLNPKKYLLVFDDVWNENQEKWSELKNVLACGLAGSSIVVTTRLKKVADIMGTLPSHHLSRLTDKQCWMLLRERAFGQEKEEYPHLEVIGKRIVNKCAGVPLAAKALGGLLRFKREEKDWIYVEESEIWELPEEDTLILSALRLSYHHLPLALRQCFAYCAIFPKDSCIEKGELIFFWMAHGYISRKGVLEMEDVGNNICNELVLRSLLQYDSRDADKETLIMHDLVHDLAQSIMENKIPGVQVQKTNVRSASDSKIREVNLHREFVAFPKSNQSEMDMSFILKNFFRLRILDASRTEINKLSSAVGNLKHLRQLNLSGTEIRILPDSLCGIWNLHVLNLDECRELEALPKKMRHLVNLRHLCLKHCDSLTEMPSKIGELTCLQTLSRFIVGRGRGNGLEELQRLNLGGELELQRLERVTNPMDAKKANIAEKKNLRHLKLYWKCRSEEEVIDEKVLEALEPPPNLETLEICGFKGRCFPVWMSDPTMKKLVQINISLCESCMHLPQLGELPHLKTLSMKNLARVEYIIEDQSGNPLKSVQQFPSLVRLNLRFLDNLKGLFKEQVMMGSAEAFPNLEVLCIEECSLLTLPPMSTSLKKLTKLSCTSLNLASSSKLETLTDLNVDFMNTCTCITIETLQSLTNLKKLEISNADDMSLPEEGMRALKSLTSLSIKYSEKLVGCLPQGWLRHLTALEELEIFKCPEVVELPEEEVKYLKFLKAVNLFSLQKMVYLPKALQHLSSSLQRLSLYNLPQLSSLPDWLGDFTSLEELSIIECPKVTSLPTRIRGMTNLHYLFIWNCPELKKSCEKENGEDWQNIQHIPNLLIR